MYGFLPILYLAMWGLFLSVGLVMFTIATPSTDTGAFGFSLVWFSVMCGVGCFWLAMINLEVKLFADGSLEFRSVLRRVQVDTGDIVWVGFSRWDAYTLRFSTGAKTLRVMSPLGGLHALLDRLIGLNPQIQLRGL